MPGYFDVDRMPQPPMGGVQPGPNATAEYQVSGLPWATGSQTASPSTVQGYHFPCVTSRVIVRNHASAGTGLRVGFTVNGTTGSNFFLVDGAQQLDIDVRLKSIFVLGNGASPTYSIFAELTTVPSRFMPTLTGSFVSGSWEGVG